MRVFKVPFDMKREEKIFGGYLKDSITKTSCELVGETYVKGAKAGEGTCK